MISEDYCSYEIAKLLKEKGFAEPCQAYWRDFENGDRVNTTFAPNENHNEAKGFISMPTHQMAMKFLRKIKKIFINIRYVPESKDDSIGTCYVVDIYSENNGGWVSNHIVSTSFERTAEESLTFCLTKLI